MLRQELLKRKKTLENYIRTIEAWLKKTPDKTMSVSTRKRNGTKSFRYFTSQGIELSKAKDSKLIGILARKDYFTKVMKAAEEELSTINFLLAETDSIAKVFSSIHEARREFVTPLELPVKDIVRVFLNEVFPPSDFEITSPIDTMKGEPVRSWPEALIADSLFIENIPYRYERPFKLHNGHSIRSDFSIIHPETGELFIWEHFGRMDKPGYQSITLRKLKDYSESGMILGKNLIATFDNDEYKISKQEVMRLIKAYFK